MNDETNDEPEQSMEEIRASMNYTFEEFTKHIEALDAIRSVDVVSLENGQTIELIKDDSPETLMLRVAHHFRGLGMSRQEVMFKASRLVLIIAQLSLDMEKLEAARLVVMGEPYSLIHPRAWRAFHHFYITQPLGGHVSTEEMIAYAKALPEEAIWKKLMGGLDSARVSLEQ